MNAILFSFATALAQAPCNLDAALAEVREKGSFEDYMCLSGADSGGAKIVGALADTPAEPRLTRALAIWMLHRSETPFDALHVETLTPADRRLLVDGIRARRGRKSPVPDHDRVFAQFGWYKPVATYTDARLKPGDAEQIALLDRARPTAKIGVATADAGLEASPPNYGAWMEIVVPAALALGGVLGAGFYLRQKKA